MHIFYTPNVNGNSYTLSEEESKHCVKVLRLTPGSQLLMVDGIGNLYQGHITDANAKHCTIGIDSIQQNYGKRPFSIHIAMAPTKNIERFEWFLEKAVEIGIDKITPLLTQHSERKVVNADRLEKIIMSAMKQSIKAYKPELCPLTNFSSFIKEQRDGAKLIAHCIDTPKPLLKNVVANNTEFTILIGPEGDFSPEEVALAKQCGYTDISLGKSRLRTETAGVVACHTVNVIKENE